MAALESAMESSLESAMEASLESATTGSLALSQPPPEMIAGLELDEMPKTGNVVVRCGCYPGLDVVA